MTETGVEYYFNVPKNAEGEIKSNGMLLPVFFDGLMSLYDVHYRKLHKKPNDLQIGSFRKGPFSIPEYQVNQVYPTMQQFVYPNPGMFTEKEEYEAACKRWEVLMGNFTSTVFMPSPILSKFYVPKRPPKFVDVSTEMRYFKQVLSPLLPKNHIELQQILLNPERPKLDSEKSFNDQIPYREEVKYKHQISFDLQWQSQMVPREPMFFLYDKFEDFEKAYQRWGNLAITSLNVVPIPPSQMLSVAKIDEIQRKAPIENTLIETFEYPANNTEMPYQPLNERLFLPVFGSFMTQHNRIETQIVAKPKNYHVIGVDKNKFQNDMEEYGVDENSVFSRVPVCPLFSVELYKSENEEKLLQDHFNLNWQDQFKLIKFLYIDFSIECYQRFLMTKNKDYDVQSLIDNLLNSQTLEAFVSISKVTPQVMYRCALVLRTFFNGPKAEDLLKYIIENRKLAQLLQLVRISSLMTSKGFEILPLPVSHSEDIVQICVLYLLSALVSFDIIPHFHPIQDFLLGLCKTMSISISSKENIFESLSKEDCFDSILSIIALIPSHSLQTAVFSKNYRALLEMANHSPKIEKALTRFTVCGSTLSMASIFHGGFSLSKEDVYSLTPQLSNILVLSTINYYSYLQSNQSISNPVQLFNSYLEIASQYKPAYYYILKHFGQLFTDKMLINNSSLKLETLVDRICTLAEDKSLMDTLTTFRLLIPIVSSYESQRRVLQQKSVYQSLVHSINEPDQVKLITAWSLFNRFSEYPMIYNEILTSTDTKIPGIFSSNPLIPTAVRELSNFLVTIIKKSDQLSNETITSVIREKVGSIACIHSRKQLAKFPEAQQAIENLVNEILSREKSTFKELATTLKNYITSNEKQNKS